MHACVLPTPTEFTHITHRACVCHEPMQARDAAVLDPRVAGGEVKSSKIDLVVWSERDDEDLSHAAHLAYVVDMWVVRWVVGGRVHSWAWVGAGWVFGGILV